MNTSTLGSPFPDAVGSSQKQFITPNGGVFEFTPLEAGAAQRAQSAASKLQYRDDGKVAQATLFTTSLSCTQPSPILARDEEFVIPHPLDTSLGIAALARRDQVFGSVVEPVGVNVVGNKISLTGSLAYMPDDHRFTPMAGMRARTDRIVENLPMLLDSSEGARQRVSMPIIQNSILDPVVLVGLHAITSGHNEDTIIGGK